MFGNKKNKGKKGKVQAAPVAPHKVTKKSGATGGKRAGMSAYFHESVVETVMPDFKANKPFEISRGGVPAYIGLLFDTNDIGGFSKQFSNDEAKGTIIESVNSNHIKALITPNLMARECMILIPDAETIENMEEFAALTGISYKLCAVTDTGVTELETTVSFEDVKSVIENGGSVKSLMADGDYDASDDDEGDTNSEDDTPDMDDVEPDAPFGGDEDDIGGFEPEDDDSDDEPGALFEPEDEPAFNGFEPEEDDDDNDDGVYDEPDSEYREDEGDVTYGDEDQDGEPEEPEDVDKIYVEATKVRRFYSNDLGMEVTTEPFDSQFLNSNPFIPFDEDRGDGWLDGYVSQMAKDANAEMRRMHQSNVMQLRERYFRLMQAQCGKIARELDIDDSSTLYGDIAAKFMAEKSDRLRGSSEEISQKRADIQRAWEEKLEREGEDAARDAQRVYQERYGRQHDEDLRVVEHQVRSGIERDYEMKMRELRDRRHMEAMKRLDMSVNETLAEMSEMHLQHVQEETARCKELQNELMAYLDNHRKEDAAVVAVQAEKLAQEEKADRVLAEQTEKLNKMTADFEARTSAIQADLDQAHQKYMLSMKQRDKEYEDMVAKKDAFAKSLQDRVDDLTVQLSRLDDAKNKEYASRMRELENERASWEDKCDHLIQVHKRSNVLSGLLVAVVIIACLAIGFVGGQYMNSSRSLEDAQYRIMQSVDDRINNAQQRGLESQVELD